MTDVQQQDLPSQLKSLHIIVVDDEPVARRVLVKGLEKCGYENVTCCSDAFEALDLIKKNTYHVALCDVLMPGMDGLALLTEIRKLPHTNEMSVIMVSATEDLSTVYKCMNSGADDYMVKPIRLTQLKNLWSNIWKKRKERSIIRELQAEKHKTTSLGQELENLQSQLSEMNLKIDQAVDTPINAITRTIGDLQNQANLTPEIKNALRQVLQTLASSDLYRPAFTKMMDDQGMNGVMKKWLMSEMGGGRGSLDRVATETMDTGKVEWASSNQEDVRELRTFEYDVWSKKEEDLLVYLNSMFDDFGLLDLFHVDREKFKRFLMKVRSRYVAKNPYHNFIHGFDVTQSVYAFLTDGEGASFLNHLEIFSLLTAAICHDVGHFGLNNPYLIATGHELAIRYNDQSVLESFHCSLAFTILSDPECNILENLDKTQYNTARKLIINCILATDLAKHVELLNKFQAVAGNFQADNADHHLLLMQLMIKSADISNPAKPFPVARYWADMVQEEFFIQGDIERKEGREISGFMDRDNSNLALMQLGFVDYFVVPLFSILEKFLPRTERCVEILLTNRKTWENIKQEQQE